MSALVVQRDHVCSPGPVREGFADQLQAWLANGGSQYCAA